MGVIHLITPEYPPRIGGVASYTRQLANGLTEAGERVHVWCGDGEDGNGFVVHPVLGQFRQKDLDRTSGLLDQFDGRQRLIVQWVPHGYGQKSMNIGFCLWLFRRANRGDRVELIVHEPYLHLWEGNWRQTGAAVVHRVMTTILLRAAACVWMSAPAWERMWRPYTFGKDLPFTWLPIPSAMRPPERREVASLRGTLSPDTSPIVGHLGTYGSPVTSLLERVIPELLEQSHRTRVLMIGAGSDRFAAAFAQRHSRWAGRVTATGSLTDSSLAAHVAACDVLVQPYPDGVSSRRTTVMAGLRLGVPIVTTTGYLTEPLWEKSQAVRLVPFDRVAEMAAHVTDLLSHPDRCEQLSRAGRDLYERTFALERTIAALTGATRGKAA
jgi:glycosyltransferase involved in cell wall biosynthesis